MSEQMSADEIRAVFGLFDVPIEEWQVQMAARWFEPWHIHYGRAAGYYQGYRRSSFNWQDHISIWEAAWDDFREIYEMWQAYLRNQDHQTSKDFKRRLLERIESGSYIQGREPSYRFGDRGRTGGLLQGH